MAGAMVPGAMNADTSVLSSRDLYPLLNWLRYWNVAAYDQFLFSSHELLRLKTKASSFLKFFPSM